MKNLFFVFVVIISLIFLGIYSKNSSLESELTRFHDEKMEQKKRNGKIKTNTAQITFSFIPTSPWSICEPGYSYSIKNSDKIVIAINENEYMFIRSMANLNAVPNPTGSGKFMESWRLIGGEQISRKERKDIINVLAKVN